ncbi:MAG: TIM barrel protein [Rhodospirillales bacterium]|jgi:hydroxypyruvate isomerase|nr:hydroxypyruvate isomerase [Rhodospirillaceae bacterium]MDP6427010.1 TIM barrel protein [Rhodospirillales bacterium]MDP6643652.1 TIM barrel protein [Rhodospirillales bacterium]MDP6840255.1 TIM barrel protein [Rhodospirillales bacterium]
MPRFSANISMMFTEREFLGRFAAARDAGFGAVEMQFPYDLSPDDLRAAKQDAGVEIAVININAGDLASGGPGLAAMPGRQDDFKRAAEQACEYGEALRPLNMNVLAGWPPLDQFSRQQCLDVLAANANLAAEALAGLGIRVTVEAVNSRDRPGYLITTTNAAIEAIDAAGHANLGIEYDIYHMQIMEGDLINTIGANLDRIGHIQFADTPGRHQPGTGEINFPFLFGAIDDAGWSGWLGAEYVPSGRTEDSLQWLQPYL